MMPDHILQPVAQFVVLFRFAVVRLVIRAGGKCGGHDEEQRDDRAHGYFLGIVQPLFVTLSLPQSALTSEIGTEIAAVAI
jgi:hypothetical protein